MNNMTALSHLMKMREGEGGTKNGELTTINRFDRYILKRKITITDEYGSMNVAGGKESRETGNSSKRKMNSNIFKKLCLVRGISEMDLITLRVLHQLHLDMS